MATTPDRNPTLGLADALHEAIDAFARLEAAPATHALERADG